jgi:coenzyme F420-reducing hydrogenase delta subunit/Pyruvate/2-oxoacid:ferredoxin oxidoreductase delta subunit
MWAVIGLLLALSLLWPIGMAPPADLFRTAGQAPFDVFFSFWLPVTRAIPVWMAWAGGAAIALVPLLVPWWSRPVARTLPAPSSVDEHLCTGCEQCYLDCPYEAISMIRRAGPGARSEFVAHVDSSLCVSCGICAGSCAPMGVGPPGRTGRDQLAGVRTFVSGWASAPPAVVFIGCSRSAAAASRGGGFEGAPVLPVSCAGSLHTSVIEYLLHAGAGGVLVASCPPRDCWNREGPKWLEQRMYHEREAELQERVDRTRVRIVHVAEGEPGCLAAALREFRADLASREAATRETAIDVIRECDSAAVAERAGR